MKPFYLLVLVSILVSCKQLTDPTAVNINTVFSAKDFSMNFVPVNGSDIAESFREDHVAVRKGRDKTGNYTL